MMKDWMKPKKNKTKKFIALLLYCIYLFVFLEASSRIILSNKKFFKKICLWECVSDVVWRHMWINRQKQRKEADIDYGYDNYDPLRGWVPKPNVTNMIEFNNKFINTNSKGVRGKREFSYKKNPNKTRIIILGESFSFGTEVSDNETYAHYLQELLPNAEVINLAVHGYGYDQMLLHLKKEGVKYNPDIVILAYLDVDKKRSLMAFRDFAKPYFVLKKNKLLLKNVPVPTPQSMRRKEFFTSKFVDLLKILYRNIQVKNGNYYKKELALTNRLLEEIADTAKNINAVCVFAYLEGIRDTIKKEKMDKSDKEFFARWTALGAHCIYLLPYINHANSMLIRQLNAKGPIAFKRQYGHYNPREHYIIAQGIYDYLIKHHLVKK